MPGELTLSLSTMFGFLLVLARVSGALVFVPLPGLRQGPELPRVVLSVGIALALLPQWPALDIIPTPVQLAGWLVLEAELGILVGLAVGFLAEAFLVGAQIVGLPAGYAYASVIDPQTQADSGVLLIFAQLAAGMLFFALGFDREVVRLFARSLETMPPGAVVLQGNAAEVMVRLGSGIFSTGLRLALPVLALLLLIDLALALLGRVNAQLQLLTLAFPVKMLTAVLIMAWTAGMYPRIYTGFGERAFGALRRLIVPGE